VCGERERKMNGDQVLLSSSESYCPRRAERELGTTEDEEEEAGTVEDN
jgi:hypothetical protein